MTQPIVRFALIAVCMSFVSPVFGQQAPVNKKQEVKTETKQEAKTEEVKEAKTETKETEKSTGKKKAKKKECCQMRVRSL